METMGPGLILGVDVYLSIAFSLLLIVSAWRVFVKAGEPGWAIFIPFYNAMVMMRIAEKPMWWVVLLFLPIVQFLIYIVVTLSIAGRFGKGGLFGIGLFLFPFIFLPILAFDDSDYEG